MPTRRASRRSPTSGPPDLARRAARGAVRSVQATHRRVARWAAGATVAALVAAVGLLEAIGPPPSLRIDLLWVQDHRAAIRTLIAAVAIAAVGLLACVALRGGRWLAVLAWIVFVVLVTQRHAEQAQLIVEVIRRRLSG